MSWTTFDSNGKQQIAGSVADMPVGTIIYFASDNPPNGWLKCDGSTVSRTGFSDLFAVISTNYGTGDGSTTFTLPNINGAVIFATPLDKRIKVLTPPQYVSALPAAPIDGQEIYYQASTASGVTWHLRYNAASSSSYKWEYVGGSALRSEVETQEATTSTTYADLATVGPSITVPVAGDYDISAGAQLVMTNGSAQYIYVGLSLDNAATILWSNIYQDPVGANDVVSRRGIKTVTRNAGSNTGVIKMQYKITSSSIGTYYNRYIFATPVRVG